MLALHCQSRGYDFVSYDEEDSISSPTTDIPKGNYSKDFSHWYDKSKSTTLHRTKHTIREIVLLGSNKGFFC